MLVTVLANKTLIDGIIGGKSVKTWALFKHYIMTVSKKHKQVQGMTYSPRSSLPSTNTLSLDAFLLHACAPSLAG